MVAHESVVFEDGAMKLLIALVLLVGCSGNEGKPIDKAAGSGSATTAAVGSGAGQFEAALVELDKYRERMCKCEDAACADTVFKDFTAWRAEFRKATKASGAKPSPETEKKGNDLNKELMICRVKVTKGAGKGSGSAGSGSGLAAPAVRLLENGPLKNLAIRASYLRAIAKAQVSVLLQNAYFLPDRSIRTALIRARKRGVEISVIVPGRSDVRVVRWASLYVYQKLTPHGVRVLRWRGPMMHAKSAVVDASWSTIGSYNLDARSLRYNLEVAVEIVSATTGADLAAAFTRDAENCDEFSQAEWRNLAWYEKALAWLMYRFRRWM